MEMRQENNFGMMVDHWLHKSCDALIGVGDGWATIYMISSDEPGKGHATELMIEMKKHYEANKQVFGSSVALNSTMKHLLKKLDIIEYT